LNQCALYGIKGNGQLSKVLGDSLEAVVALVSANGAYKTWAEKNGRQVQAACPKLRKIHARIATLLRRIRPPEYRHSGVRKRSFLTNAAQHCGRMPTLKLDIRKFYPSTSFNHVWLFFFRTMKCSADVAHVLATICTYRSRHLPTGGVHSEVLAFYCHKSMLDALNARVTKRGGVMTVYVDDIVVTMPSACRSDLEWTKKLMERAQLTMHDRKSRVIRAAEEKMITGISIRNGRMSAPAGQHRRIKELHAQIADAGSQAEALSEIRSLQGHLDHVAQIDPKYAAKAKGNRARFKSLLAIG